MKRLNFGVNLNKSDFFVSVIKGTFFLTLGTVISKVLVAIAYIILARILSANEYGEFGMVTSTINNFLIFASLGIGLTTTKYISENKNKDPELASGILGTSLCLVILLGLIITCFFLIFSEFLAVNILKAPQLESVLNYAAIILVLTAFNVTQIGALLGLQSFKTTSLINFIQGVLVASGLVVGGLVDGVRGAVIGNLIALLLLSISIHFLLKKEGVKYNIVPKLSNWRENIKTIYKFALPASLSSLITSPALWILNAMLVRTHDGYVNLGIYTAVIVFSNALQMLNSSLNNVLLPIFLSTEDKFSAKKEYINYFGSWIISILFGIPLIIFPEIVSYIIGDKYPADTVVVVLGLTMVSTFIISNKQGISRDLIIKNKMWLSVFSMGQWAITTIVLFSFFKVYGVIAFAGSIAAGYFINLVLFVPFFVKMKVSPAFIFYNKWIILIWMVLFTLIFVNIKLTLLYRVLLSPLLLLLLVLSFNKLFFGLKKIKLKD